MTMVWLAAVVGIDGDVVMIEIAGPDGKIPRSQMQMNSDGEFVLLHELCEKIAVVWLWLTVVGDGDATQTDGDMVGVGVLSRLANRHDDASPVGVRARHGGFDKGRIGDGEGDDASGIITGCSLHMDGDAFARTFAVSHNLQGEVVHHGVQMLGEWLCPLIPHGCDGSRIAVSRADEKNAVGGGGITIHSDGVKTGSVLPRQNLLQHGLCDVGIGEYKTQHGCHVGSNHAGAFGNRRDRNGMIPNGELTAAAFGKLVGGHDGARRLFPAVTALFVHEGVQCLIDALAIYWLANHACGGEINIV